MNGNHRTPSGGYRTAGGSYRTPSGEYRNPSGSHRVGHGSPPRGRLFFILAGVVAGVAVCAVSAVLVVGGRSTGPSGQISAQRPPTQQEGAKGDRAAVPDACSLVTDQQAETLVPHFDRNQLNSASDTDTHSQCAWTLFSSDSGRQLTVELRVIAASGGQSAAAEAKRTFETEQASDDAGKGGLSTTQRITFHKALEGIGDAAYVVYSIDDSQGSGSQGFGDAGLNARIANVLITVHYGGSKRDAPMATDQAVGGATETAKNLIRALAVTS